MTEIFSLTGELFNMDVLKTLAQEVPSLVVLVWVVKSFIKSQQGYSSSMERMEERHRETMKEIIQESATREAHMQNVVEKNTDAYIRFSEKLNKITEGR